MQLAKNLQKFQLITFDITDTLLRFRADPAVIYKEKALQFGLQDIDLYQLKHCFQKTFKMMNKTHPNFGKNHPDMTWQQWWLQLVHETFLCIDPTVDKKKVKKLAEHLFHIFRTKQCWKKVECMEKLLEKMRESGKSIGVISNFDPSLRDVLLEMNILHNFDFVITAYEAGFQKPETEIFELALKIAKAKPSEALHIGNSFDLDYIGATKNSGWSSLLLTNSEKVPSDVKKDFVYKDICDMLKALETKNIEW